MHGSSILFVGLVAFTGISFAQFPYYIAVPRTEYYPIPRNHYFSVPRAEYTVIPRSEYKAIPRTTNIVIPKTGEITVAKTKDIEDNKLIEENPGIQGGSTHECERPCSKIYEPVCAVLMGYNTRTKTFANGCKFANAHRCLGPHWTVLHKGPCKSDSNTQSRLE